MKYKDPNTGEFKQLYLPPTGDTLPIGSADSSGLIPYKIYGCNL